MSLFSLENKIALITGASRGIGESMALTFAEYGAHCILVSRKLDGLEAVVEKIRAKGGSAEAMACNMGEIEQIQQLMDAVEKKHGRLDILVNNAAANPYFGEMLQAEPWAWEKTHDVNLKGPFFMTQRAAKMMKEKGLGGAIVNVSSVNGVRPAQMQGIYSVTKAALISMTLAFAKELAPFNIRVNALLPGMTETKFSSAITENEAISKAVISMIPLKRIAAPSEMAGAALYLVSEASSYTTGTCLVCDGGMLA
ncbi:SDR family oxidoreductase [Desulfobotulus sp.]|jgi:NAD(P)-dependent dehydrogenase (short-subunit alcohol dehydrogenase family)|uniref:SDR family oxidoreductase n=1 Tax=Desulfobotulus sp. TaxID=1940337 RepID=UPI002A36BEA5|nr:SDR family oxidoreductase [Desulfobotulus sp.]MDY0161624.1 SDR family oxidoreductase [Desulfobotulus sp.]